ncbi:FHA domain-containing protein [Nocardioides dongxiaopingii]|uniref:FHA domain-containing protein n=1 Tax=Nocardioides sp. S-1144 TaxID=2582905 RepID=UPI001652B5FB|nr:FHA domain-containing protein [Nocardioides sp. S-1144]
MTSIRIQTSGQTLTADSTEGARVFTVGRDAASDITSLDPTVSRRHAEIRALGQGWEVVDLGSSVGTFVGGRRVERADLTGTTVVGFGRDGQALTVTVTVTPAAPQSFPPPSAPRLDKPAPSAPLGAPAAAPPQAFPPPVAVERLPQFDGPPPLDQTVVTGQGPFPGFGPAGPGLLVRRRTGKDLRFPAGMPIRVGRDPVLEVHADDQAVSRLHAVLEPRPDGWWWVDRSTSGSFIDGERITQHHVDEPVEISLGHPTAGYEIEVVPVVAAGQASARIQARKRRRTLALVGGVVGAMVLVGGGITGVALLGDDDPPAAGQGTTTDPAEERQEALTRAKAAAVLLTAFDESDQPLWSGSGSIITEDGLILTNAHVADPDAPGQTSGESDPAYLTVSLTSGEDDKPASAAFRAAPIVSDGYLDVAVLQIESDAEGNPVEKTELDLPEPLPIGDSDDLRTGDRIIALGYPAIGNLSVQGDRPLTVTEGVVSTFQADEVVGTPRGSIDSDVRLGSGNSGGPSINEEGEIIGLNTRVVTAGSDAAGAITQGSALIVPVNLATAVLDIARDGGDPSYVSPYLDELPTDPGVPTDVAAQAAGWVREGEEGSCAGASSPDAPQKLSGVGTGETLMAEFNVEGLPDGLPLAIDFYDQDDIRIDTLTTTWDLGPEGICIWAPLELSTDFPEITAVLSLGQESEPVAVNPLILSGS